MGTWLITGGAGFVGSKLDNQRDNYEVATPDNDAIAICTASRQDRLLIHARFAQPSRRADCKMNRGARLDPDRSPHTTRVLRCVCGGARAAGRPLPKYVQEEFKGYLKCGRLDRGLLRVRNVWVSYSRLSG
jgi:hypothetical protein